MAIAPSESFEWRSRQPIMDEETRLHAALAEMTARLEEETARRRLIETAYRLDEGWLNAMSELGNQRDASVEELAQFTIDETTRLTDSEIGYLYFVNDAEDGIISYFWSKGSSETCAAVESMDYTLAHAGIWADALRYKRAFVHNDYPNEPSRHGLPKGHRSISRHMGVPVLRDGKVVAICGVANKPSPYDNSDQRQLLLISNRLWSIIEWKRDRTMLEKANAELLRLANVDGLTGVANRRALDIFLDIQWRTAARERYPVSLLILDIDFFKAYNDTYGHQAGDETLKKIGKALAKAARRPTDLAARYGGEEFVLILGKTEANAAFTIAQELVKSISDLGIAHERSACASVVSVSIGVASSYPTSGSEEGHDGLVNAADAALYAAKQGGRNRAVLAEAPSGITGPSNPSPRGALHQSK
jgi:diguanylate cyclase (GGDEF)-like protein